MHSHTDEFREKRRQLTKRVVDDMECIKTRVDKYLRGDQKKSVSPNTHTHPSDFLRVMRMTKALCLGGRAARAPAGSSLVWSQIGSSTVASVGSLYFLARLT